MSGARSFTQWSMYDGCPRKFKYRYKDRIPVVQGVKSEAAIRGTRVHESIEHYFEDKRPDLDPEIHDNYFDFVEGLKDNYEYTAELKFAINKLWEPCDYKDENCLVRGFIDLVVFPEGRLNAFEWKTGKEYDEHIHQKMLYGMVLLILYPDVKDATVTGVYLDQQMNRAVTYRREMLGTYKWMWDRRFSMMDNDEVCAPNPSFKCRWCDYSKANGGPCSF